MFVFSVTLFLSAHSDKHINVSLKVICTVNKCFICLPYFKYYSLFLLKTAFDPQTLTLSKIRPMKVSKKKEKILVVLKFGIALLAVAFAADQCYVCVPDTKTEDQCKSLEDKQLKTCSKGQCYTVQVWFELGGI